MGAMLTLRTAKMALLVAVVLLAGFLCYKAGVGSHEKNNVAYIEDFETGELKFTLSDKELTIYEEGKAPKRVAVPKTGTRRIAKKLSEDVQVERLSWMPKVVFLPQLGISAGLRLEPLAGIQLIRLMPLRVGLSCNISPSMVGLGIERDILSNSCVGLMYGYDWQGYSRLYLTFKVFL